jgi:hypothetical protein
LEIRSQILARSFRTKDIMDSKGTIKGNKLALWREAVIRMRRLVILAKRKDTWIKIVGLRIVTEGVLIVEILNRRGMNVRS